MLFNFDLWWVFLAFWFVRPLCHLWSKMSVLQATQASLKLSAIRFTFFFLPVLRLGLLVRDGKVFLFLHLPSLESLKLLLLSPISWVLSFFFHLSRLLELSLDLMDLGIEGLSSQDSVFFNFVNFGSFHFFFF